MKGAVQTGRPLSCAGGLAAFEDRYGFGVVGMGEHVDGRDLEQAIASVEELVQVALLGHGVTADIGDAARLECAGGFEELGVEPARGGSMERTSIRSLLSAASRM